MYKDIKDVFKIYLKDTKYNTGLYLKIKDFRLGWTVKSSEYTEFLGGVLLGIHNIRFSSRDEEILFTEILNIDANNLRSDIYQVKGINPNWKVSSNHTYLTLLYLMHAFLTEGTLSKSNLVDVIKELYYIFAYKTMSSLVSHGFKHNVKESIAKATYEKLSNKYIIRRVGSWQGVFEYRAQDVLPPNGLHIKALKKFTTEDAMSMANDIQGRIRDMFKNIYSVMMTVINEGSSINDTTLNNDTDEESTIKDITNRSDLYITNINTIINKSNDFIKDDIITLISSTLPNLDDDALRNALYYISKHYDQSKDDYVIKIITNDIDYLNTNGYTTEYLNDIVDILYKLKGYWNSSRVTNKEIPYIKKEVSKIVTKSIKFKTKWVITTVSTGVILYIFVRSVIKKTL